MGSKTDPIAQNGFDGMWTDGTSVCHDALLSCWASDPALATHALDGWVQALAFDPSGRRRSWRWDQEGGAPLVDARDEGLSADVPGAELGDVESPRVARVVYGVEAYAAVVDLINQHDRSRRSLAPAHAAARSVQQLLRSHDG